ncbi:unnamed protein product, partial [Mesorhabditis spiculigera]
MACAYSILQQNLAHTLILIDRNSDKLKGELMDLGQAVAFTIPCKVHADSDYAISKGSKLCIITAGARQQEGESRIHLVQRNVEIFKGIIPELVKHSPETCIMVVSNPVDVLSYVAWKLSGLPRERVWGSGTNLDSGRFRFLLSERLNIAPASCNGWIIGEHGDSSVAVWSETSVTGVSLTETVPIGTAQDEDNWREELHKKVVGSAYEIIKLKGYTSWAIGLSVANILHGMVTNGRAAFALSINVKGVHGIKDDLFLSLPVILGTNGVTHIIRQNLNPREHELLKKSASTLLDVQNSINI